MSFCNITCNCGHMADIEEFTRTPLGPIPDRRTPREVLRGIKGASFQCPQCNVAWHIEKTPILFAFIHRVTTGETVEETFLQPTNPAPDYEI